MREDLVDIFQEIKDVLKGDDIPRWAKAAAFVEERPLLSITLILFFAVMVIQLLINWTPTLIRKCCRKEEKMGRIHGVKEEVFIFESEA